MQQYIPQQHLKNIDRFLQPGKAVIIYGACRTGKTTLIRHYMENYPGKKIFASGDDIAAQEYLGSQSVEKLKNYVGTGTLLVIDEAQYIPHIGLNLKLLVDSCPDLKVIATGSSSFELAQDTGEPLTGRKFTLRLFPLAQMEIGTFEDARATSANLESRLIYGSYPEVVTTPDNQMRQRYLQELIGSYLFKDILQLEGVRNADKLSRLLQLLAFQIGKEVSVNELGAQLGMSKNTVDRYLDLLQKVFVIVKRTGFSRNLRKEIARNNRYFFCDNGIRNALIQNFNPLSMRDDSGALWENYVIIERMKNLEYHNCPANSYFWRTYDKQEIDLVEERSGKLFAYEIKLQKQTGAAPRLWARTYPDARYAIINKDNYHDMITRPPES